MGVDMNEKTVDVAAKDSGLYPTETRTDQSALGQVGNADELQRHLGNRQLQLIAIGKFTDTTLTLPPPSSGGDTTYPRHVLTE